MYVCNLCMYNYIYVCMYVIYACTSECACIYARMYTCMYVMYVRM